MRKDKLTFNEIQTAEQAADDRRRSRAQGFNKMHERDKAEQMLSNGMMMYWHVHKDQREQKGEVVMADGRKEEFTTYRGYDIPDNSFLLEWQNKHGEKEGRLFNLNEFRRWIRWA